MKKREKKLRRKIKRLEAEIERQIKRLEAEIERLNESAMTYGIGEIRSWQELAKIVDEKIWRVEAARHDVSSSDNGLSQSESGRACRR